MPTTATTAPIEDNTVPFVISTAAASGDAIVSKAIDPVVASETGNDISADQGMGKEGEAKGKNLKKPNKVFVATILAIALLLIGLTIGLAVFFGMKRNRDSNTNSDNQTNASNPPACRPFNQTMIAQRKFCQVFDDDFNDLNLNTWKHEVSMWGGGNNEFQAYVNSRNNSYVRDSILFLKPTLTSSVIGEDHVLNNFNDDPSLNCTVSTNYGCVRTSNGSNIINPIISAKLTTAKSFSMRFGKLEVKAQLPVGDYLWPAIYGNESGMMPKNDVYGTWPSSGEIDIMESRGNAPGYINGGVDQISSTLHWGPNNPIIDPYLKTHGEKALKGGKTYADDFHIYGLEWTPEYLTTYIDDPANVVMNVTLKDFWNFGNFTSFNKNATNIWAKGCDQAPFDQEFYIILNLAVGGTNGYFPEGTWNNSAPFAPLEFYNSRNRWYGSWGSEESEGRAMKVDRVTAWELC
ncbi:hypothetical protein HDU97_006888 [Phlyctochytrium planicorne]|nr:hypothetical protein HDU97_006888 [Phlyctochytrium planicorne]